jgi:hypothetical protein
VRGEERWDRTRNPDRKGEGRVRGKRDGTALGIQRERERDECGEKRDRTTLGIQRGRGTTRTKYEDNSY